MDSLLIYFIQLNVLISVIYAGYYVLLKYLTFYKLNRFYFVIGLVFSLVYPFLDFGWLLAKDMPALGQMDEYLPSLGDQVKNIASLTLGKLVYGLICIGIFIFACRFIFQLLSLLRVYYHSVEAKWKDYLFRNVVFPVAPFSFLNKIYLHIEQHKERELHDIFEHEDIHVKGLHSVDILVFEMLLIGCWYNPFVWLMRSAVRQNLEFLTDQQVLNKGVDRQTYQYSLLQVTRAGTSVILSNQFNFKLLKTRIMMMNKKRSSKLQLSKYAFLLPIIIFSAGAFTVNRAEAQIEQVVIRASELSLNNDIQTFAGTSDTIVEPTVVQVTKSNTAKPKPRAVEPLVELVSRDTVPEKKELKKSKVLYIINGERKGKDFDFDSVDPNTIDSMSVFKREKAIDRFGKDAQDKDGVIMIKLKDTKK